MILDKENVLSEDQALTSTGGTASTNVIPLQSVAGVDSALGTPLDLMIQVTEAFDGGTSVVAAVQTDDAENFGSAVTLNQSAAILTAALVAGYRFRVAIPREGLKKYLRVLYTCSGTYTAGKVFAAIVQVRD